MAPVKIEYVLRSHQNIVEKCEIGKLYDMETKNTYRLSTGMGQDAAKIYAALTKREITFQLKFPLSGNIKTGFFSNP